MGVAAGSWEIVLNDYGISSFLTILKIMPQLYFLPSDFCKLGVLPCYYQLVFLCALCVERYVLGQVVKCHMKKLYLIFNWGQLNLLGWKSCRSHQMMFPTCTCRLSILVTDLCCTHSIYKKWGTCHCHLGMKLYAPWNSPQNLQLCYQWVNSLSKEQNSWLIDDSDVSNTWVFSGNFHLEQSHESRFDFLQLHTIVCEDGWWDASS